MAPLNPNSDAHPRVRQALQLAGIAAAGVFSLLLLFPSVIISGNLDELDSPFLLMFCFMVAAITSVLVLWLLFLALPFKASKFIAIVIAAYALVSLALDAALPVSIGELEFGDEEAAAAPLWGSVIQIVGVVGLIAVLWNLPVTYLISMGWTFVAVIAAMSVAPLAFNAMATSDADRFEKVSERTSEAPPYNIYHVLFDCYYGPWLEWAIAELNFDQDQFAGFTHYRSVRSNHWSTSNSYPSFLSGTTYNPTQTVVEWRESQQNSSLITDLNTLGFATSLYAPYDRNGYGPMFLAADERHFATDEGERPAGQFKELWMVLDLWALRAAPVGLRHLAFQNGTGLFSKHAKGVPLNLGKGHSAFQNFLNFLDAEDARAPSGNYFHVYVTVPHPPATLDRRGRYIGKSTYMEEVLLATNMMAMLVNRLKELGRFDNSFIIFQSDHGSAKAADYRGQRLLDTVRMDDDTSKRIGENSISGRPGRQIDARFSPLLLVKPPGSCSSDKPLSSNGALTQLLDLRSYLKRVVSHTSPECTYPVRSAVDINVDNVRVGNKRFNPGRRAPSGEFQRFRIYADGAWQELPKMHFTFE